MSFPSAHGTLKKMDYILGYKSGHNKFNIIEIMHMFSDHVIKLEINIRYLEKSK